MHTAPRHYSAQEKEALTAQALSLIAQGHSRADAAKALNMGKSTLYDWLSARQTEALAAQRAATMQYLDDNGSSLNQRLHLLLLCRAQLWNEWADCVPHIDAQAMRLLAAVDRLDRMIDRLTGGLYFLQKPEKEKADSAAANSGRIPAKLPPVTIEELPPFSPVFDNEDTTASTQADSEPEFSGDFPAFRPPQYHVPAIAAAAPVHTPPPHKKGPPIPPGWGRKRSKR